MWFIFKIMDMVDLIIDFKLCLLYFTGGIITDWWLPQRTMKEFPWIRLKPFIFQNISHNKFKFPAIMTKHQPRKISTPPVRWTIITMILFVLNFVALIQNSVALRARSGHTNPWGENQRPKLYTDYLTKHSGKPFFKLFCWVY